MPAPPTDEERDRYLKTPQKRYILLIQYSAFVGVLISFFGFATGSYWTAIFVLPLLLFVVEQTIALYTSTFRRNLNIDDHRQMVDSWVPTRYGSVDVFLPTCGESLDVLDNTMYYLSLLEWPGDLRVYVLDDADVAGVRAIADSHGFGYFARHGNESKKRVTCDLRLAIQLVSSSSSSTQTLFQGETF